ncbi:TPA: hypothetical protein ACWV4W_001702 [Salmonella enterica subsp. enterica serovar Muenchen]
MSEIKVRGVYLRICGIPENIPVDYWKPVAKKCFARDLITRSAMNGSETYDVEVTAPSPENAESVVACLLSACEQVGIDIVNKDSVIYGYGAGRKPLDRHHIIITIEYNKENQKNRGELGKVISNTLENYLDRISYNTGNAGHLRMEEVVTPDGVYISMTHGFKRDPYELPLDEPRYLMPNGRYITGRLSGE